MERCLKQHKKPTNIRKTVDDIHTFCALLRDNKVKDGRDAFLKLPLLAQCMFLQHSWEILSKKSKYSDDSYLTAFRLFKLFRSKDMKGSEIYNRYTKLKTVETYYKKALDWNRKSPLANVKSGGSKSSKSTSSNSVSSKSISSKSVSSKSASSKRSKSASSRSSKSVGRSAKKYDKEFQRYAEPEEDGALYLFYTSLYEQEPKSRLAITWLTEHGVYEGSERKRLEKHYAKLNEAGKLIK